MTYTSAHGPGLRLWTTMARDLSCSSRTAQASAERGLEPPRREVRNPCAGLHGLAFTPRTARPLRLHVLPGRLAGGELLASAWGQQRFVESVLANNGIVSHALRIGHCRMSSTGLQSTWRRW